jgi:hypothetical protein
MTSKVKNFKRIAPFFRTELFMADNFTFNVIRTRGHYMNHLSVHQQLITDFTDFLSNPIPKLNSKPCDS